MEGVSGDLVHVYLDRQGKKPKKIESGVKGVQSPGMARANCSGLQRPGPGEKEQQKILCGEADFARIKLKIWDKVNLAWQLKYIFI